MAVLERHGVGRGVNIRGAVLGEEGWGKEFPQAPFFCFFELGGEVGRCLGA